MQNRAVRKQGRSDAVLCKQQAKALQCTQTTCLCDLRLLCKLEKLGTGAVQEAGGLPRQPACRIEARVQNQARNLITNVDGGPVLWAARPGFMGQQDWSGGVHYCPGCGQRACRQGSCIGRYYNNHR